MADLSITEEIADFYGAYYDPVADTFLEMDDSGILSFEDASANHALRGARIARKHAAPQPVVDREAVLSLLDSQQVGAAIPTNLLGAYRRTLADAVLALINGTAK